MEPGAEVGNEEGWPFVLRRIGLAKLSAAALSVGGGIWLFPGILEDVISGASLVTVDMMFHKGLQGPSRSRC